MTEEAVSIAIDDDAALVKTPGAEEPAIVVAKTPPTKTETPPELADMKRQLEEAKAREATERTGRTEAERVAREQAEARGRAETQVADSRVASVTSAIEAEEAKASNAERDYETALAGGDFKAASKAQREMSAAEARLQLLNRDKAEYETAPKREPTHEGAVRAMPRTESDDPVEAMAKRVSAASAAWIRANPDVVKRPNALTAAHYQALDEGLRADTPEYFAAVEKHLGIGESKVETERQEQPKHRAAATASAPVGAGNSSSSRASQDGMVMLSALERDMARSLYPELTDKNVDRVGISDAERTYARNKQALIREGKLSA